MHKKNNKRQHKNQNLVLSKSSRDLTKQAQILAKSFRGKPGSNPTFSLDDMITASRIIDAHEHGIKLIGFQSTDNARKIAAQFAKKKTKNGNSSQTFSRKLNKAIILKNRKVNKPTQSTIELYKKMMIED